MSYTYDQRKRPRGLQNKEPEQTAAPGPGMEARADREGAMAAAGQQVYGGPVTHALSGAVPSTFSAGTMQARRDVDRPDEDKGKLDVEAAYSDLGNELALYDSINNRMIDTPAMEEYMEQNPPEAQSEEEQAKVEKAFSLLNSKNAKSYLRTEEGIQYEQLLQKQQMEAWKDTYKGPKRKKSN